VYGYVRIGFNAIIFSDQLMVLIILFQDSDTEDSAGMHDLMRDRAQHYLSPDKLFPTSPFSFSMPPFGPDQMGKSVFKSTHNHHIYFSKHTSNFLYSKRGLSNLSGFMCSRASLERFCSASPVLISTQYSVVSVWDT